MISGTPLHVLPLAAAAAAVAAAAVRCALVPQTNYRRSVGNFNFNIIF
jgi:hypothetical protein